MMAFNGIETNPDLLLETNVYRWNHDLRHGPASKQGKLRCRYEEIEVKCVFRTASFESCWDHGPVYDGSRAVRAVDGVHGRAASLLHAGLPSDPYYANLRERDIAQAALLCFHFRVVSRQQCVDKTTGSHIRGYRTMSAEDLMACDFPEVIDDTLRLKSRLRRTRQPA